MTPAKLLSFALLAATFVAMIGTSFSAFFSHDAAFGLVTYNGANAYYPHGSCVRSGVLSYGCPAGAVCIPRGAYYGFWSGPGICYWAL
uniref:Putative conserved secreted protein n=1 Tax=Amblyomma tuberculatum TaxID=48802 RepID=A0A6M2E162_9ACAR